ncbi:MAG: alpha/beta hydrolase [Bacteroidales bacterium]|nr:alpha/beta hydrolase [Bacteroidales bacterium]MBN2761735.1 alpha/beta hydrolase [Bacteroidales bacterium]
MLHGGPGAPGDILLPAVALSAKAGVFEPLLTQLSITGQIDALHEMILNHCHPPVKLAGHSWGAWLAYLYAAYHVDTAEKTILIGAGSFDIQYNVDLMKIRLNRLSEKEKSEAMILSALVGQGEASDSDFRRFGELMSKADSYDCEERKDSSIKFFPEVYNAVWKEADELRHSGELLTLGEKINCPVIAIHGIDDPHPVDGVEKPLKKVLHDFRCIRIEKCGHYPWREKYAKALFYQILERELGIGAD